MATYYVATNGNDSNTPVQAQNILTPWLTIDHARANMVAGDILDIRQGNYNVNINWSTVSTPVGTSFANAPTIRGHVGELVTIRAIILYGNSSFAYVIFDNLTIDQAGGSQEPILVGGSPGPNAGHHCRFTNCIVTGGAASGGVAWFGGAGGNEFIGGRIHHNGVRPGLDHGLYMHDGGGSLIEHVEIDHNFAAGIQMYNAGAGGMNNSIFRYNLVHENGQGGTTNNPPEIYVDDGNNVQVYNNIVWGGWYGIVVNRGTGNKIYNNVSYGHQYRPIMVSAPAVGAIIKNNICKNSVGYEGIGIIAGATNTVVQFNCTHGNAGGTIINNGTGTTLSNNLTSDPLFVNNTTHDFHLQSSSPCRDAGTNLSPDVINDYDGVSRPQGSVYDIGAYEFVVGGPSNKIDCMAYYDGVNYLPTQYSMCTVVSGLSPLLNYAEVLVRCSGSGSTASCYGVVTDGTIGSNNAFFFKMVNNVVTILAPINTTVNNGDKIKLLINLGNVLSFYKDSGNGFVLVDTYSLGALPELTSGSPGLGVYNG